VSQSSIVLHGLDTVKVNVQFVSEEGIPCSHQELPQPLLDWLEWWQSQAQQSRRPVPTAFSFHDARLVMYPNGASAWRYLLRNDCVEIKLGPRLSLRMVAKITLLSAYLWDKGHPQAAIEEVRGLVYDLLNGKRFQFQVAQLDMCADVVGLCLPTQWEEVFVTHALVKRPVAESQKERAYYRGRQLETIIFSGHGAPVNAKLYHKVKEIHQKKDEKAWFFDLWRRHGWDGVAEVWRCEFSVEREGFREMGIETIEEALRNLKRLWAYCSREWLRMVIPDAEDRNRHRWAVHPLWEELQHAFDQDGDPALDALGPLVRVPRRAKNIEQLTAQLAGCATTLAAWYGEQEVPKEADPCEIALQVAQAIVERWEEREVNVQDEIRAKRFIYSQVP